MADQGNKSFLSPFCPAFSYREGFWSGRLVVLAVISVITLMDLSSGQTAGQQQLLQILAVPWLDRHASDIHRLSHQTTTCTVSISPIQTEEEVTKGTFVHFVLAGSTFIVRGSLYNGRFCSVEVSHVQFHERAVQYRLVATTKLQYQILDIKAAVCSDTEAYIVAILTRDGLGTEPQLLVFKPDEKDRLGKTFIIAHNGQLSTMKGVSDVSIKCFHDHVVFGLAASTILLPSESKDLSSSIRIWSPKSRTVIKQLTVETMNAVSVVAFESSRCLIHVFLQRGNAINEGPLDSLVYCVTSESRTVWRLTLIQRLNFCEVSGVELYLNSKQELGLFVAISKNSDEHPGCPRTSLSMKWAGRQFITFGNISVKAVSDFYYFPTTCCNLLAARHVGAERALTIVGSTEPIFEGVHKTEFMIMNKRNFLLVSFTSDSRQGALHEILCDQLSNFKTRPYENNRQLSGPPLAAPMLATPPQMGMIPGPPPLMIPGPLPLVNTGPIQVQPFPPMRVISYPGPSFPVLPILNPGPQFFPVPGNRDRPMGNVSIGSVPGFWRLNQRPAIPAPPSIRGAPQVSYSPGRSKPVIPGQAKGKTRMHAFDDLL